MTLPASDIKAFLILSAIIYGAIVLIAALYQRNMTYFPGNEIFVPKEWDMAELETLTLQTGDGLTLHSWYRAPKSADKITIVFFQGNGQHPGVRNFKIQPWLKAGYGVLLVGYRGYGGNTGSPTEEGIYSDARAAIDAVVKRGTPESRLVLYGESLGTGVATQMATTYQAAALILESPFTSLPDAGAHHYPYLPVRLMMRDRYDSLAKIGQVKMPLLILHGGQDKVVPAKLGRKLFVAANEPKQAAYIPQAGHNDLYDWGAQGVVMKFLDSIHP